LLLSTVVVCRLTTHDHVIACCCLPLLQAWKQVDPGCTWLAGPGPTDVYGKNTINEAMKKLAHLCGYDNPTRCTAHGKRKSGATAIVNAPGIGPKTTINLTRHSHYSTVAHYEAPQQESVDRCIFTLAGAGGGNSRGGGGVAIGNDDDDDKKPAALPRPLMMMSTTSYNDNTKENVPPPSTAGGRQIVMYVPPPSSSDDSTNNNKKLKPIHDQNGAPTLLDSSTYEYCMGLVAAAQTASSSVCQLQHHTSIHQHRCSSILLRILLSTKDTTNCRRHHRNLP